MQEIFKNDFDKLIKTNEQNVLFNADKRKFLEEDI